MNGWHNCEHWLDLRDAWNDIPYNTKSKEVSYYGPAISKIEYISSIKMWVAHCDEYATPIKYCPFCGVEL